MEERAEKGLGCPVGLSDPLRGGRMGVAGRGRGTVLLPGQRGRRSCPDPDRQGYGVELRVEKGPGRPGVEPVLSCRLLVHLDRRGVHQGAPPHVGAVPVQYLHGHGDPCAVVAGNGSVFRGAGAPLPGKMPPGGGRGGALSRTTAVGSQTPGDTPADRGSADCRPRPVPPVEHWRRADQLYRRLFRLYKGTELHRGRILRVLPL